MSHCHTGGSGTLRREEDAVEALRIPEKPAAFAWDIDGINRGVRA
jgi:hypothetical protein